MVHPSTQCGSWKVAGGSKDLTVTDALVPRPDFSLLGPTLVDSRLSRPEFGAKKSDSGRRPDWRRTDVADLAPTEFGAKDLAPTRFGAKLFAPMEFGANDLAPTEFGANDLAPTDSEMDSAPTELVVGNPRRPDAQTDVGMTDEVRSADARDSRNPSMEPVLGSAARAVEICAGPS
jgi:hypothetical protein